MWQYIWKVLYITEDHYFSKLVLPLEAFNFYLEGRYRRTFSPPKPTAAVFRCCELSFIYKKLNVRGGGFIFYLTAILTNVSKEYYICIMGEKKWHDDKEERRLLNTLFYMTIILLICQSEVLKIKTILKINLALIWYSNLGVWRSLGGMS